MMVIFDSNMILVHSIFTLDALISKVNSFAFPSVTPQLKNHPVGSVQSQQVQKALLTVMLLILMIIHILHQHKLIKIHMLLMLLHQLLVVLGMHLLKGQQLQHQS